MNLNKVYIIGRLTQDPDARTTPSGQQVATIRLATSRVWNDQATKQKREATEFHTIIAWGRLAEICSQYLRKGGLAMFEGRLQTRSWDDKQTGAKRYITEIVAESMQLGPRSSNPGYPSDRSDRAGSPANNGPRVADVRPATNSAPASSEPDIPVINEDELTVSGVEEESKTIKDSDLPF